MIEDTRCGKNCAFIKAGICDSDEDCPNYCESFWQCSEGQVKCVKDCAPKRASLESQRSISSLMGMQSSIEQMRDRIDNLETLIRHLCSKSEEVLSAARLNLDIVKKITE